MVALILAPIYRCMESLRRGVVPYRSQQEEDGAELQDGQDQRADGFPMSCRGRPEELIAGAIGLAVGGSSRAQRMPLRRLALSPTAYEPPMEVPGFEPRDAIAKPAIAWLEQRVSGALNAERSSWDSGS